MTDHSSLIEDSLLYYSREKMYRTMQIVAVEGIKRFPEDPVYKLYYCVSLIHEERNGEAVEGLSEIEGFPDVSLACNVLLELIQNPHETLDQILRDRIKDNFAVAGEMASYVMGVVFLLLNKPEKARPFIQKVLKVPSFSKKATVLMGWIELIINDGPPSKEVWKYFENADNSSSEIIFGRAKYFERQKNFTKALDYLNQGIVLFPKYPPAFVEKMKMHLALEDWDQTLAAAQRALFLDANNIEALRFTLLHMLSQGGKSEEIEEKLKVLYLTMLKNEPKNAKLFCETAQLLSRLSGSYKPVLEATFSMAKKAVEIKPNDPEINAEYGYQYLNLGKTTKALALFKSNACDRAVAGSIQCLIEQEDFEHASEQVKAYMQLETEFSPEMLYIFAFLEDKFSGSSEKIIQHVSDALKLHMQALKGIPWSTTFYRLLHPFFIHEICRLFTLYVPSQLPKTKCSVVETLKLCQSAVQMVHSSCPGFLGFSTTVLLGNLKMLEGDLSTAKALLYQCLEKEDSNPEGRIIMAQLHLRENNLYAASHCLEVALSFNFEVREDFDYLQVKAEIQKKQGLLSDAAETLNFAKSVAFSDGKEDALKSFKKISLSKKIQLYVQLIKVYCDLNKQEAANAAIHEADSLFRDTPEFDRLRFAVAYFALSRNDVDGALKILEEIEPNKSCYFEALQQRADIYLNYKKNRIKYINCYRDAVKERNTPDVLNLLGDAYIKIQEPEKAVEAYEHALKQNPKDSDLASKIGTALVKTHNYEKAVTYYKAAIKSGGSESLRFDLCSLLYIIKRYKEAEEMITAALENGKGDDNLDWLIMESKYMCLLSEVYSKIEMEDKAMTTLQKAWNVQTRVLRKVHLEQTDSEDHHKKAKEICCQIAQHASKRKDFGTAVQFYREALTFDESDTDVLLSLARLQIESHDIDAARQYCATVMSKDTENIPAAVMLADMMFEAGDLQSAKFQFQKLLDIKPDFYEAIARYIEVVRRLGKLDQAEICLKKAEAMCNTHLSVDPGYYYCKGLYEWYTGNTSDALKCFNKTRSIPLWGQISLCHMIEICINPENDNFSGENVDADADIILKEKAVNSQEDNIRTAEKLLMELKSKFGVNINTRIFNNLIRLAKHSKSEAETALNDFLEILSDERYKDHVGGILGSAMAYLVLKQTPRARNQLKRIAKTPWNFSDAEYLEKAWLLLADIYIKAGKFPSAVEILDKVLLYNKSCTKAYDLYGYIAEKEQNYKDAVKNYEKAWVLTSKSNPVIGYKLAFNNMKAKCYADAIDVCQVVLIKYPNYPKIRKEILDRSRTYLRT